MQLKYGCDPEIFLSVGGKYISAHGLFPGDKKNPFKVDRGAIQVDGLALEFNIDPVETAEEFDKNITVVLAQMDEMVKKVDKDMKIEFRPFVTFDKKYFKDLPDTAKILGCDPDFRAVDGKVNPPPEGLTNQPFRTAAGHFHIGWTENEDSSVHFEDCRFIADHFYTKGQKYNIFRRYDTIEEAERLRYYGKNGSFRPKPYGVELRQFSNLWVQKSEDRLKMFNFIDSNVRKLYKE